MLLLAAAALADGRQSDTAWQQRLHTAVELLAGQHYTQAESLLTVLASERPDDPAVLYQRLAVRQTRIVDYESYPFEAASFLVLADSVIRALERNLAASSGSDSTACLFYLGNALGAVGLMHAKQGNWLSGMGAAVRSKNALAEVLKRDSAFCAAHLGVGMFNYYLGRGFKWVPFVAGRSTEGLRQIERATQAEFPYDMAAKNTLCWILIERNRYAAADSVCAEALKQMPRNTIFVKVATCIALWTRQHQRAIERGRVLVDLSLDRSPVNWNDVYTGYVAIAESQCALGRQAECRQTVQEALSHVPPAQYLDIAYVREHMVRLKTLAETE
jgi:hypothetical protein